MSQHTKGPWSVVKKHPLATDADEIIIVGADEAKPLAFLHPIYLRNLKGQEQGKTLAEAGAEAMKNAALIAAAPDLLESLKNAVSMDLHHRSCTVWLDRAKAAIAKAEGR